MQEINLLAFVAANKKLEEILEIDKSSKFFHSSINSFSSLSHLILTERPL